MIQRDYIKVICILRKNEYILLFYYLINKYESPENNNVYETGRGVIFSQFPSLITCFFLFFFFLLR